MDDEVEFIVPKDRCPELDIGELKNRAEWAKAALEKLEKVPVPAEKAADSLGGARATEQAPAKTTSANKGKAAAAGAADEATVSEEAIHGEWVSAKGKCKIFLDSMTRRLSYEEALDDGCRLHGWLVKKSGELCWQSTLWILDEDQPPWYGPSFGEEPEAVGDILALLLPGPPTRLQTQIRVEGEDTDWQPPVTFAQLDQGENVLDAFGPFGPSPGPMMPETGGGLFVFGGGK